MHMDNQTNTRGKRWMSSCVCVYDLPMDTNGILEGSISMSGTEILAEIYSCSEIFVYRNNGLQGWQH